MTVATTGRFMEVSERYLENAIFRGNIFQSWQFWVCLIGVIILALGTYSWFKKRNKKKEEKNVV